MGEDNGRPADHRHLVAVVFRTLRWYLAEQQCLAEDNRTLCDTFGKTFPPPTLTVGGRVAPSSSSTSPRSQPQPSAARQQQQALSSLSSSSLTSSITLDQLLGWLTQVLNAKSALVRAYREFFGAVAPMATGKIEYQGDLSGLHAAVSQTLRDFLAQQQQYVQAVRDVSEVLARALRPADFCAPPVVRQLPRAAGHPYAERFFERLVDNLDAEYSLDTAHVTYCGLVCGPPGRCPPAAAEPARQLRRRDDDGSGHRRPCGGGDLPAGTRVVFETMPKGPAPRW